MLTPAKLGTMKAISVSFFLIQADLHKLSYLFLIQISKY